MCERAASGPYERAASGPNERVASGHSAIDTAPLAQVVMSTKITHYPAHAERRPQTMLRSLQYKFSHARTVF
jgi:hypothetical protein